jgi:pentatricopeptide repeat protein
MYGQFKDLDTAFKLYNQMTELKMVPDSVTLTSLITACANVGDETRGRQLHQDMIRNITPDIELQNSLIKMYGKCKDLNTALDLYYQMRQRKIKPDTVTYIALVTACADLEDLKQGEHIHEIVKKEKIYDGVLLRAILNMYGKCGELNKAIEVFKEIQTREHNLEAGVFACVLNSCKIAGDLAQGKKIHSSLPPLVEHSPEVLAALISMYAHLGELETAISIFNTTTSSERDTGVWTSMIAAFGYYGKATMALEVFNEMVKEKVQPNHVTFVCLLNSCSHAALVDTAKGYDN